MRKQNPSLRAGLSYATGRARGRRPFSRAGVDAKALQPRQDETRGFGRQCLPARRMVERVRFTFWSTEFRSVPTVGMITAMWKRVCASTARRWISLCRRCWKTPPEGLLEDTLVVWASEMGERLCQQPVPTQKSGQGTQLLRLMHVDGRREE